MQVCSLSPNGAVHSQQSYKKEVSHVWWRASAAAPYAAVPPPLPLRSPCNCCVSSLAVTWKRVGSLAGMGEPPFSPAFVVVKEIFFVLSYSCTYLPNESVANKNKWEDDLNPFLPATHKKVL